MIADKSFFSFLVVLNVLNIIDAVCTAVWVEYFGAIELNIFMDALLSLGYPAFIALKTLAVLAISWFMWDKRNQGYTNVALKIGIVVYGCIVLYETVMSSFMIAYS